MRGAALACWLALVGACGFPTVTYDDDASLGDAATGDATSDGRSTGDGASGVDGSTGADGRAGSDGSGADGDGPRADAPAGDAPHDAPHFEASTCDQDGDGHKAMSCGGDDCCDTDFDAHPGQTMFFTQKDACGSFDYDCDTKLTPEFQTAISCTGTSITGCMGGPGFVGAPACGETGPWATCAASGVSCKVTPDGSMPAQGCR